MCEGPEALKVSAWPQGMRWEPGAGCLEQALLATGLREEVPSGQGWGAQEGDQHGGDGRDGPGERTGGKAVRGGASGGTGWGRWPCAPSRLFGDGRSDSLPRGGKWSGRGTSQSHRVQQGEGGARGFECGLVTPQRFSTRGSRARSVSASWELRRCRRSGPAPLALSKTYCGRKSVGGSGGLCVLEPSRGFSGSLKCDTWSDTVLSAETRPGWPVPGTSEHGAVVSRGVLGQ